MKPPIIKLPWVSRRRHEGLKKWWFDSWKKVFMAYRAMQFERDSALRERDEALARLAEVKQGHCAHTSKPIVVGLDDRGVRQATRTICRDCGKEL